MAERKSREEKMSQIQEKLEEGLREIYQTEKYKEYIDAMARFPHYSINNCILIVSQCPQASLVCGFRKWQNDFNRCVNKGEKGIMIIAPVKVKAEVEENVYGDERKPVLDSEGNQVTKKMTREFNSFRPAYVFDVSQTSGDPLPQLVSQLTDVVEDFEQMRQILIDISPVPVEFSEIDGGANGYFSHVEQKIVVKEDLPQLQTLKTMIHEIAHATLGHGGNEDKWDRETKEVQAESVAYWVSQMLGMDTSEYSFGYISGWSKDKEVSELKENLELIKTTTDQITIQIEKKLSEYAKKQVQVKPEKLSEIKKVSHHR